MKTVQVNQLKKELFSAEFEIKENDKTVGTITLSGDPAINKKVITGTFHKKSFSLNQLELFSSDFQHMMPFSITELDNQIGEIFEIRVKTGLFSMYSYLHCSYQEKNLDLYTIGFGKEGLKSPIYCDNVQIAQIEKDCTIKNDLHHFTIYALDQKSAYQALLFTCYNYATGYFKAGQKVTQSISNTYTKTTNKELLSKYNPNWKDETRKES